jgi:hypothetical protein
VFLLQFCAVARRVISGAASMKRSIFLILATTIGVAAATAPAAALDRRVRVINKTGETMMKFQASNRDSRSWEEDILGRAVLNSGQAVNININDGTGYCVFDFRATFRSGAQVVRRNVNVCKVASWTITD